ncbi:MAG: c-type cytochrome [Phycisphaera sp.]|nr:c-type cytochrome [Phycisphaera sp.]
MRNVLCRAVLACLIGACLLSPAVGFAESKPIRALMITGGCCHDYQRQQHTITQGISARCKTPIEWTIVLHSGSDRVPVYEEDLAKKYDIIFHNECFANETDPKWIDKILAPHRAGMPGVVMHCAMHSYGFGKVEPWVQFLGVRSHNHGAHYAYKVETVAPDNPIVADLGKSWDTPKGELYRISEVLKTATPLAQARRLENGKPTDIYDTCFWTNIFENKTRVFGTTVGHHNETVETQQWMNTVARGFLWALDRLDAYQPVSDHGHEAAIAKAVELAGQTAIASKPAADGDKTGVPANLASGMTVKASSEETNKNNLVKNAVDGDLDTRWCASSGSAPQWLQIDLGEPQHVRGVRIHWEAMTGCAYQYTLEGSADGNKWNALQDESKNGKPNGVDELKVDAPNTRYLRVNYLGSSTGAWGSIREIEAYEDPKFPELVAMKGKKKGDTDAGGSAGTNASINDVHAPDDFDVTMFAVPPKINYPVCLVTDVSGAVYIGVDPNGSLGKIPGKGHVMRCVDTDGDGVADQFTKVTDVRFPRGLFYDHGQLWVQHPPTVTLYTDKDGDGVADESKDIVTGISTDMNEKRGADHTTNGMRMGIDGWLYIATGDFGYVKATGSDGKSLQLHGGAVTRIRPDGSEVEIYDRGTRNICDVAVDPYMNIFARDNTNDGGGWDVRLHHVFGGHAHHGYPILFKNFQDEMIEPLADYGGGSGTGALYVQEPGFGKYSDALLTADWGRSVVYYHPLTPNGADFKAGSEEFVKIPRPTDLDVDPQGDLYIASWKNGGFSYKNEDVGFVARLTPKDHRPTTPPDLGKASDDQLLGYLTSPSHSLHIFTQREILRRGDKPVFRTGLEKLGSDGGATLASRVAAIYTLKQLLGAASTDALLRVSRDPVVRSHALRAIADRLTQVADVPVEPFVAALKDADPRVRLQAVIGLGRLGKPAGAAPLVAMVADPDPLVAHDAIKAMVLLDAGDVALKALDTADARHAAGLCQVLQALHEPAVVNGLIQRLNSTQDRDHTAPIFRALCRLYNVEAEWQGEWWGTRPDTRGPYYNPTKWEQTDKIDKALTAALKAAPADVATKMIVELTRQRVSLAGMSDVLVAMAEAGPAQRSAAVSVLATLADVPPAALPLLKRVALDDKASAADRATAAKALSNVNGNDARDVLVATLGQLMSQDPPAGEAITAFEAYISDKDRAKDAGYFAKVAQSGDAASREVAYAVLLGVVGDKRVKGKDKKAAEDAMNDAWKADASTAAALRAIGRTRDKDYEKQVRASVASSNPAVHDAAIFAAQALRLTNVPGMASGDVIAKLKFEKVLAAAQKLKGDVAEGAKLFTQQGCIACHTVSKDQPPKGPMLADIGKRYSRAELIESILKPSAKIAQGFDTQIFVLKDGTTQVGFVTSESGDSIELRNIAGLPTKIKPGDVKQRTKQENSIMPEGLVANLTTQQLASILDYLQSLKSE